MTDPWKADVPNNRLTPGERYQRDPMFRQLVDYMQLMIQQAQYTPTELREAAILAAMMETERRPPQRFYLDAESWLQAGFDAEDVRQRQLQGQIK